MGRESSSHKEATVNKGREALIDSREQNNEDCEMVGEGKMTISAGKKSQTVSGPGSCESCRVFVCEHGHHL